MRRVFPGGKTHEELARGVCDYVVRPRLVRGENKVPSLVTFAALFGGIEILGFQGRIAGPVLMALAISVLRLYASEARKRRHLPIPAETLARADRGGAARGAGS